MCLCVLFIVCHRWHRIDDGIECDEESGDGFVDWNRCDRWKAVSRSFMSKYSCITCAHIFSSSLYHNIRAQLVRLISISFSMLHKRIYLVSLNGK